jgi:hypothetical protein
MTLKKHTTDAFGRGLLKTTRAIYFDVGVFIISCSQIIGCMAYIGVRVI